MKSLFLSLYLISTFLIVPPLFSLSTTLRSYDIHGKYVYYTQSDIVEQAARFTLPSAATIKSITIALGGDNANGSAIVHVYGHEGGTPAPILSSDLIEPVTIRKTAVGVQKITVPLALSLHNNQFFISVEHVSSGVYLLSDSYEKPLFCQANDDRDVFTSQLLKRQDGRWYYGKYAYVIDVEVEYLEKTEPLFERDTAAIAGQRQGYHDKFTGISCGDINNDGYIDVLANGQLFLNRQNGKFENITHRIGNNEYARTGLFLDINNDGDIDILLLDTNTVVTTAQHKLFINSGGIFNEYPINIPPLENLTSFSVGDVNSDGFPDIFLGQQTLRETNMLQNYLLLNDKNLSFIDHSDMIQPTSRKNKGSYCTSAEFIDINGDNNVDLYIGNSQEGDDVWISSGDDAISYEARKILVDSVSLHTTGCFWFDIDNNGTVDLLSSRTVHPGVKSNMHMNGTTVLLNMGKEDFILEKASTTVIPAYEEKHSGGVAGDVNNDGLMDYMLFTSCECRYADLYLQNKEQGFDLKTIESGLEHLAATHDGLFVDVDNDGRLDLLIIEQGVLKVYRNRGLDGSNFIQLDLQAGKGNKQAIGARVKVFTASGTFTRSITSGRGVLVQDPTRIHVGLGVDKAIDSILVFWPNGSSSPEKYEDIAINTVHRIVEGKGKKGKESADITMTAYPNPFSSEVVLRYRIEQAGEIEIAIYDVNGRLIKELLNGRQGAGLHTVTWDGRDQSGMRVSPGLYLCGYSTDGHQILHPLTVIDK